MRPNAALFDAEPARDRISERFGVLILGRFRAYSGSNISTDTNEISALREGDASLVNNLDELWCSVDDIWLEQSFKSSRLSCPSIEPFDKSPFTHHEVGIIKAPFVGIAA
jgi:hypothetical protein